MKIKTKLSIIFLSIICLITISNADTGFGISDVGTISSITGIEDENTSPVGYFLDQNYPNPFNPITKIKFSHPKSEYVTIEIYNMSGQKIIELLNNEINEGTHEIEFNAGKLSSGVYYYRIQASEFQDVKKMVFIK
jgi:hypothetical protein